MKQLLFYCLNRMKIASQNLTLIAATLAFGLTTSTNAQTKIVTLTSGTYNGITTNQTSLVLTTNQVVVIMGFIYNPSLKLDFANGASDYIGAGAGAIQLSHQFTGLTNIACTTAFASSGAVTIGVSTPSSQQYAPANVVVIPTDATGTVQIVLESSGDLVNWTTSQPGNYGNTYSNRFFRVRAIAQ